MASLHIGSTSLCMSQQTLRYMQRLVDHTLQLRHLRSDTRQSNLLIIVTRWAQSRRTCFKRMDCNHYADRTRILHALHH